MEAVLFGIFSDLRMDGYIGFLRLAAPVLAAILLVLTRKVKQTKDLHPVVFIALSAVVGIVFGFAGV